MIRGTVFVNQTIEFDGSELVVGINGAEFTYFKQIDPEEVSTYCGKNTFLNVDFTLEKYDNKKAPIG